MAEVISTVDSVFDSPEFDEVYQARLNGAYQLRINQDTLAGALQSFYRSPDRSDDEASYMASGHMESSAETLREIFGRGSDIAVYGNLRDEAQSKVDDLDEALIGVAEDQGISQFASYGLWRHRYGQEQTNKDLLKQAVKTTERNFLELEAYVNENSGRLLTCVSYLGVYGAILAGGDIRITNRWSAVIPTVEDRPVYAMSFDRANTEQYEQKQLRIDAHDISDGRATYYDNWTPLLNRAEKRLAEGVTLASGEVAEGPLYLNDQQREEADFYQFVFERVRTVGRLAAADKKYLTC